VIQESLTNATLHYWSGGADDGLIFLLGGAWELYEITVPLLPLLLIGAGLVLLIGVLGGRHLARRSHG